jgi:cell wall-associated NlpC family hydrolase
MEIPGKIKKNAKHAIIVIGAFSFFMLGIIIYAINSTKEYIAVSGENLESLAVSGHRVTSQPNRFARFEKKEFGDADKNKRDSIVTFAKSLLGTPYAYAQSSPKGFDCSGFIYYVYSRFNVKISRSSYTIAEEGVEIDSSKARKGDLIFFRGTDINDPKIGHIGIIITEKDEPIEFIHSSSNTKNNGVIITKLNSGHYRERFVKIKSVL